jgi:hypothetical protein
MFNTTKIPVRRKLADASYINKTVFVDEATLTRRVSDLEERREILMNNLHSSRMKILEYEKQLNDNSSELSIGFIQQEIQAEREIINDDADILIKIEKELMRYCNQVITNASQYSAALNQKMRLIYKELAKKGYRATRLPIRRRSSKVLSSPRKMAHACNLKKLISFFF